MNDAPISPWQQWWKAAETPAVDAALRKLYAQLDEAVAARGPTCWVSGRCCRFDTFGHRLYVTGLEIAWFLQQAEEAMARAAEAEGKDGCPWQIGGLCSAHDIRPLGCRAFFCQQGTEDWQHEIYERFLDHLRAMHDARGLPYQYIEWRAGLSEAAQALGGGRT